MIINDLIILFFLLLFLFFLIIKIFSSLKKRILLNYLSTPLIIFSVITISLYNFYNNPDIYNLLITLGLILSLIGDIFNLFEKPDNSHLFNSILFFLLAHLIYIKAFLIEYRFTIYHILILSSFIIIIIYLYKKFKINISYKSMKIGIIIYMVIISITFIIALGNLNAQVSSKSLFISSGMFIFWLSDLFLGINAFIKKIKYNLIIIWMLYAPGQLLIALSTY